MSVKPGIYRHFKGGMYRVIATALDTETEIQNVVYESVVSGQVFTRPLSMFIEEVPEHGPRFQWEAEDLKNISLTGDERKLTYREMLSTLYSQFLRRLLSDLDGREVFGIYMFRRRELKRKIESLASCHLKFNSQSAATVRDTAELMERYVAQASLLGAIEELREDEGNSVEIFCANPDFGGPAQKIACLGDWTNWERREFFGESLEACFEAALAAYRTKRIHQAGV